MNGSSLCPHPSKHCYPSQRCAEFYASRRMREDSSLSLITYKCRRGFWHLSKLTSERVEMLRFFDEHVVRTS